MILKILEHAASATESVNYSEDKFLEGTVDVVGYGNMPNSLRSTILDTFEALESKENITTQARNYGFHCAINPGVTDVITDDEIPALAKEYLERLGYGGQPYVIYRHRDIDRIHYHVVSSRILPDGHLVSTAFEQVRSHAIGLALEEKYHYHLGKEKNTETRTLTAAEALGPRLRLVPEKPIREQIKAIVNEVHEFDYRTRDQFFAIMEAFGFHPKAKMRKGKKPGISGYGVDEDGNHITRLYAIDLMLKTDIVEDFKNRRDEIRSLTRYYDEEAALMTGPAVNALKFATSEGEYKDILRQYGFECSIVRKDGEPKDIVIVDKAARRVNNISILEPGIDLSPVRGWKEDGKKRYELTDGEKMMIKNTVEHRRLKWHLVSEAEKRRERLSNLDTEQSQEQSESVSQIRLKR